MVFVEGNLAPDELSLVLLFFCTWGAAAGGRCGGKKLYCIVANGEENMS